MLPPCGNGDARTIRKKKEKVNHKNNKMMKKGIYAVASYIAAVFAVLRLLVFEPVAHAADA